MKIKDRFVSFLLRCLGYQPGTTIEQDKRKYIIDIHGARRRLGREE